MRIHKESLADERCAVQKLLHWDAADKLHSCMQSSSVHNLSRDLCSCGDERDPRVSQR
jgi:hypothetical protein